MGNCIRKGSSTEWGGEDWASFGSGRDNKDEPGLPAAESVLPCSLEVKIKISKKELQKLLKEADVEGMSVEKVLAQLVAAAAGEESQRPWRPALGSIPEYDGASNY